MRARRHQRRGWSVRGDGGWKEGVVDYVSPPVVRVCIAWQSGGRPRRKVDNWQIKVTLISEPCYRECLNTARIKEFNRTYPNCRIMITIVGS